MVVTWISCASDCLGTTMNRRDRGGMLSGSQLISWSGRGLAGPILFLHRKDVWAQPGGCTAVKLSQTQKTRSPICHLKQAIMEPLVPIRDDCSMMLSSNMCCFLRIESVRVVALQQQVNERVCAHADLDHSWHSIPILVPRVATLIQPSSFKQELLFGIAMSCMRHCRASI